MRHKSHCGPGGRFEIDIPDALFGMGGRGWQGKWGPFHFDFGDGPEGRGGGRGMLRGPSRSRPPAALRSLRRAGRRL